MEKMVAIEKMAGGPVNASRLAGISYVTWWRWKNKSSRNTRAAATIELLHKTLLSKTLPPAGQADSPPKVSPELHAG